MADIFTVEKRSEIMSRIKSKNTGPELAMAAALKTAGIRFRMHANLIGKPDFVLVDMGITLFVDGEFWHGHTMTPEKRMSLDEFWTKKIDRNVERDAEVNRALKKMGWRVIRVTDRDVNRRMRWVLSKVWRSHGQLTGKNRRTEPEERVRTLNGIITRNNRCKKTKKNKKT